MRTLIRYFTQLLLLLALSELGNGIVRHLDLPLPGGVVGMLLLLLLLTNGVLSLHRVEKVADLLVRHLSFFFIPIAVGLMAYGELLRSSGISLLLVLAISASVGLAVTGFVSQFFLRRASGGKEP